MKAGVILTGFLMVVSGCLPTTDYDSGSRRYDNQQQPVQQQTFGEPSRIGPPARVAPSRPVPAEPQIVIDQLKWYKKPTFTSRGALEFLGTVTNWGTTSARYVKVQVLFYDAAGNLLTTESTYCEPHHIAAGGIATFKGWADYFPNAETCRAYLTSSD